MASGAIAKGDAVACIRAKKSHKGCGTRRSTTSESHTRGVRSARRPPQNIGPQETDERVCHKCLFSHENRYGQPIIVPLFGCIRPNVRGMP